MLRLRNFAGRDRSKPFVSRRVPFRCFSALLAVALFLESGVMTSAVQPAFASSAAGTGGSVLGIEARGPGTGAGRLVDVLVGPDGSIEAAIIELGGFLGIGSRKIAVDWSALSFTREGGRLVAIIGLPADQLRAAPEYKPGQAAVVTRRD
jgi:hypothetical protein